MDKLIELLDFRTEGVEDVAELLGTVITMGLTFFVTHQLSLTLPYQKIVKRFSKSTSSLNIKLFETINAGKRTGNLLRNITGQRMEFWSFLFPKIRFIHVWNQNLVEKCSRLKDLGSYSSSFKNMNQTLCSFVI